MLDEGRRLTAVEKARMSSRFAGGDRERENQGSGGLLEHIASPPSQAKTARKIVHASPEGQPPRTFDFGGPKLDQHTPHRKPPSDSLGVSRQSEPGPDFIGGKLVNRESSVRSSVVLTDQGTPTDKETRPVRAFIPGRGSLQKSSNSLTDLTQGNFVGDETGIQRRHRCVPPSPKDPAVGKRVNGATAFSSANMTHCVKPDEDGIGHTIDQRQQLMGGPGSRKAGRDLAPVGELSGGFSNYNNKHHAGEAFPTPEASERVRAFRNLQRAASPPRSSPAAPRIPSPTPRDLRRAGQPPSDQRDSIPRAASPIRGPGIRPTDSGPVTQHPSSLNPAPKVNRPTGPEMVPADKIQALKTADPRKSRTEVLGRHMSANFTLG